MEQSEFQAIWRQSVGQTQSGQLPSVSLHQGSGQQSETELAGIAKQRYYTAGKQAHLIVNTARQAELDLVRLEWSERLYVRGIELTAQHINSLYVWADGCAQTSHPKAQAHI